MFQNNEQYSYKEVHQYVIQHGEGISCLIISVEGNAMTEKEDMKA